MSQPTNSKRQKDFPKQCPTGQYLSSWHFHGADEPRIPMFLVNLNMEA